MVKFKLSKKQKGQLLVEAMVAVSLMLVGLMGIFGVLSRSLGLSRVAGDQFVAASLASEGIEIAKNAFDSDVGGVKAWNFGFNPGCYYGDYKSSSLSELDQDDCGEYDNAPEEVRLYFDEGSGLYDHDASGAPSKFFRTIRVEGVAGIEMVKVISEVFWIERGGSTSYVAVEDHFYNWRDLRD
ncbi:MAG: hypothetical protein NUV96_01995 [Candidatus Colwellbacteria bacterium]|nr:hypothetical protein [Candidatus Colwellbacteria bacterium]